MQADRNTDDAFFAEFERLISACASELNEGPDVADAAADRFPPRYQTHRLIGTGGMGRVYEAYDAELRRRVAIKTTIAPNRFLSDMMRRECQVLAALHHPGIVSVFDSGMLSSGRAYYVMQYVEGDDLVQYAASHRLGIAARVNLLKQVAESVGIAHLLGVVHRDLKPANILVDANGKTHVLDFGLAKFGAEVAHPGAPRNRESPFDTIAAGNARGTISFMSPEQAAGETVDARGDVYSLGTTLFLLLTGTLPRKSPSFPQTPDEWANHLRAEKWPSCRTLAPQLPRDLAAILDRALAIDPVERYANANELASDLYAFLEDRPVVAVTRSRSSYLVGKFLRRYRRESAVAAATVCGVVALTIAFLVSIDRERKSALRSASAARVSELKAVEARALSQRRELESRRLLYSADVSRAVNRIVEHDYGTARKLLDRHAPIDRASDLRELEWWLLDGIVAAKRRCLSGHTSVVVAAAFTPDARWLLTIDRNGYLIVWDANTLERVQELRLDQPVTHIAVSPDSKLLACAGRQSTFLAVVSPLTLMGQLPSALPLAEVSALSFSPGSDQLAMGGTDGKVAIYDLKTRAIRGWITGRRGKSIRAIAYSPDGSELVTVGDAPEVRFWSADRFVTQGEGPRFLGPITAVAYSGDGQRLAVGNEHGTILTWARDSPETQTPASLDGPVTALWFSSNENSLWASCERGSLNFIQNGQITRAYRAAEDNMFSVVDPSETRFAAAAGRTEVYVGDLRASALGEQFPSAMFNRLFVAPYNDNLAGIFDRKVTIWRAKDQPARNHATSPLKTIVTGFAFDRARNGFWTSEATGAIRFWSFDPSVPHRLYQSALTSITSFALSGDGRYYCAGSAPGELALFAAESGDCLWSAEAASPVPAVIEFAPSGESIAAVTWDGKLAVRRRDTGELRFTASAHAGPATALAYASDGETIATGGIDGTACIWNANHGNRLMSLRHSGAVKGVCLLRTNGTLLTTSSLRDGQLNFWNVATQQRLFSIPLGVGQPTNPVISGDGKWLLVAVAGDAPRIARFKIHAD